MSSNPEPTSTTEKKPGAGLEGIVATQSGICFIDGQAGKLIYRGYEIGDLVEHCSFEEVAYLLWDGELPNREELEKLKRDLTESSELPEYIIRILKTLPRKTQPMDALRTAVSALAADDADVMSNEPDANRRKSRRLAAQFPGIVTAFHRIREGLDPVPPDPSLSVAGNFLYMLNGKRAHETVVRVMDAALVLHAEHGMNASTFAARVSAATLADMHSAITAAVAALKGPLHGGANQDVMELLISCNSVDAVEKCVREMLARREKVPGFGHRVYKTYDPRAHFLSKMSKQLGEAAGNTKWYEMSERLIPILKQEKNLNPNVDFFSASTYYTMGISLDLFTPIFAVARTAGWTAHVMEQHKNNRIIRPTDDYIGPMGKKVVGIDQR